jgi:molybdopterin synthase sulfur carrier subunit|tara:strand:- start:712 stop:960 length:249 start_codon:yes stop_codon:yes gene_type:complete
MNILFFASLREKLDTDQEHWTEMQNINTTKELLVHLQQRGEPWLSALSNPQLIISVNQEVAELTTAIKLGDEVAFFPPVTGG